MSALPARSGAEPADVVRLTHRLFASVDQPIFRRAASDAMPALVVRLGEREAALPLRSLAKEFGIPTDSGDGAMLSLIERALDFVAALRPGDPLPAEVLTGDASWDPDAAHRRLAEDRLRLGLIGWLRGELGEPAEGLGLQALETDIQARAQLQTALSRATAALSLRSASDVIELIEAVGRELAYIEALRVWLLARVRAILGKTERFAGNFRGDATRAETLNQVRRLLTVAHARVNERFEQVDAHTGEVLATLRNADRVCVFVREQRDWLYRTWRAWQPILAAWDTAPPTLDETCWALLGRTYQFLAPRYMSVTEWVRVLQTTKTDRAQKRMVW